MAKTPLLLLGAALAAALTAAACDTADEPAGTTATSIHISAVPETPTTVIPVEILPCNLLTEAQVRLYGYTNASLRTDGAQNRSCTYTAPAAGPRALTISVSETPIDAVHTGDRDAAMPQKIGAHRGLRVQSGTDALCTMYLDVRGLQSVAVQAAAQADAQQACAHATAVATVIEPQLG